VLLLRWRVIGGVAWGVRRYATDSSQYAAVKFENTDATAENLVVDDNATALETLAEMLRSFGSLTDPRARKAFVHTIRSVIDAGGQRDGIQRVDLRRQQQQREGNGSEERADRMKHETCRAGA